MTISLQGSLQDPRNDQHQIEIPLVLEAIHPIQDVQQTIRPEEEQIKRYDHVRRARCISQYKLRQNRRSFQIHAKRPKDLKKTHLQ